MQGATVTASWQVSVKGVGDERLTASLPWAISCADDAERLVRGMITLLGGGFHPDDPAADYVFHDTGERTFSDEDAARIDRLLGQVGFVSPAVDIYALGLRIMKELVP